MTPSAGPAVSPRHFVLLRRLDLVSRWAVLAMAPFMLHAFVLAELCIAIIGAAFVVRCAVLRDWGWARRGWFPLAMAWWLWLVVCSLPGIGRSGVPSLLQGIVVVRYLLLAAALEHHVLRDRTTRAWLWRVIAACAAYIALQSVLQAVSGHNLWGDGRWVDGELTGPFYKPRAAAPLSRLLFPALLPPVAALLARRSTRAGLAAAALTAAGLVSVVLIGQRMPLLLTLLGLVVSALLLPAMRRAVLAAIVVGGVLIAASAVVVPPTFHRLVIKFSAQMENFPQSPYGLLAARAVAMEAAHPWMGRGFNGFRTGCAEPRYFHGWSWPANPADTGGGLAGCNIHPHNHYLQAMTDSGLPGLALWSLMVLAWMATLGRGLWRRPEALRVGLFVAALVQQWPIASTSSAFAIEIGGLFFLLLGFGLAEAAIARDAANPAA